MCGVVIIFECFNKAEFGRGSFSNTSKQAPAITLLSNASISSVSLIVPPRLVLITTAFFFISANSAEPITELPFGCFGTCNEMKSLPRRTSSKEETFNFTSSGEPLMESVTACSVFERSKNITRMPHPKAYSANDIPMRPKPIIPNVFPFTSFPFP